MLDLMANTVDYRKQDHLPFEQRFGSKKFGGKCALKYEMCVSAHEDKLLWLSGPHPGGKNDKTIYVQLAP